MLGKRPRHRRTGLTGQQVTDIRAASVTEVASRNRLDLARTEVGDDPLPLLAYAEGPEELVLTGTQLSPLALARLQAGLSRCRRVLPGTVRCARCMRTARLVSERVSRRVTPLFAVISFLPSASEPAPAATAPCAQSSRDGSQSPKYLIPAVAAPKHSMC